MWWEWYAKKKAEIKNGMQRGVLLSLEKSIEIRNEIDSQEEKFEDMLKSKEQKNAELLVMHDNLKKLLEEKELRIRKLEQQFQKTTKDRSPSKEKTEAVSPANTWPFPTPEVEAKTAGEILLGMVKKPSGVKTLPLSEKKTRETEWDAEFNELNEKNPIFKILFDQAIEAAVNRTRDIDTDAKKVCLVHGLIEISDDGFMTMTEKGQYMAKKIV